MAQRVALLNAWKSFEQTHGSEEDLGNVEKQMPRRVKKRRKLGENEFEEYMDYVFPADDESAAKMSKLLQMAQKWKKEQGSTHTVMAPQTILAQISTHSKVSTNRFAGMHSASQHRAGLVELGSTISYTTCLRPRAFAIMQRWFLSCFHLLVDQAKAV